MMRRTISAVAIATALAFGAGCGGGSSSSGDSSHGGAESAAGVIERLGGAGKPGPETPAPKTTAPAKSDDGAGAGRAQAQAPQGVPLDSRSARVRKAIDDLLHPNDKSHGDAESSRSEAQKGAKAGRGGGLGILEQLRRAVHERLQQLPGKNRRRSGHDDGSGILDMLR
jgi:hypothetical protein